MTACDRGMKAVRSLSHRFSDDEGQIDAAAKAHARLTKKCVEIPPAMLPPSRRIILCEATSSIRASVSPACQ